MIYNGNSDINYIKHMSKIIFLAILIILPLDSMFDYNWYKLNHKNLLQTRTFTNQYPLNAHEVMVTHTVSWELL